MGHNSGHGLWADIYDDTRVDQYQYNKLQAAPSTAPRKSVLSDPLHSNRLLYDNLVSEYDNTLCQCNKTPCISIYQTGRQL